MGLLGGYSTLSLDLLIGFGVPKRLDLIKGPALLPDFWEFDGLVLHTYESHIKLMASEGIVIPKSH